MLPRIKLCLANGCCPYSLSIIRMCAPITNNRVDWSGFPPQKSVLSLANHTQVARFKAEIQLCIRLLMFPIDVVSVVCLWVMNPMNNGNSRFAYLGRQSAWVSEPDPNTSTGVIFLCTAS